MLPVVPFRDSRLLVTQLPARMLPQNPAEKAVVKAAETVTAALRATFHLDPIPHLMRDYVPERDTELRRTGANLSAAIGHLKETDPPTFRRLIGLVREVADSPVNDLTVTRSGLGDVMLAIHEGSGRADLTPAREMSDGMLRFLAVATALLTANRGLDIDPGIRLADDDISAGVLLVIEELENGLHPSQANRVLRLIQDTGKELGTQVIFTTHSPALLNALPGSANNDVIVSFRGDGARSRLRRLTDLPGYAEAMASGRLGDLMSRGKLVKPDEPRTDFTEFNRLLGLE